MGFSGETLFKEISFSVDEKDKIGIIGVNGAGKSTLYNLAMINQNIKNTIRINTDEIVREIGDWRNNSDQLKAAKMAINLRNECFLCGKSFNEETTLTGKSILKTIDRAKELGYELQLFYVGVSSTEIAKERIKNRVEKGGHYIENDVVEKRYYESLKNLKEMKLGKKVLPVIDMITKDRKQVIIPLYMNKQERFILLVKELLSGRFSIEK